MTEREKSYAGMLYQPGDPELSADRDETIRKLQEYNNMDPLDLYRGTDPARRDDRGWKRHRCGKCGYQRYPAYVSCGGQSV